MVLRTLGTLELAGSGFTRPKPLLLLAYLSLEGARPRRSVAELFWPNARDRMKSLTVALARLRHGAPGVIGSDRLRVWATVDSDAANLKAALERRDLDQARRLYRGPFLDGFHVPAAGSELEEWVFATREALADRLRHALMVEASAEAEAGRFEAAARRAEDAYALPGASPLPPDDLLMLYTLLRAGASPRAAEVESEAAEFDLDHARSRADARARLRHAPALVVGDDGEADAGFRYEQHIGFVTSFDGARIAYATLGEGPPLVKAANWMSHLEHERESPILRPWLEALSRRHTLVRYDERGCGLSDRDVALSLEAFERDLEVLVETLELERFPLLGMSQGAAVALAYAVRHPERVSHLILYGGYVDPEPREMADAMLAMIRVGWGQDNAAFRQVFTTLFMPHATPEQASWFNDLQRLSASPDEAAALASAIFEIDARSLADDVRVPTLILHASHDAVVPLESSRRLAAQIPGSRFVPLESDDHLLLETDPAWPRFVHEIERFLGVPARRELIERL